MMFPGYIQAPVRITATNVQYLCVRLLSPAMLLCCALNASAADEKVVFARDVEPIFARRCIRCHGPEKQKGGLQLHRRELAEKGGDSGISLLTGEGEENELLRRVTSTEEGYRMPVEGHPLAENEVDVLRRWIAQGAPWPEEELLAAADDGARRQRLEYPWWLPYTEQGEVFLNRLGYTPYVLVGVLVVGLIVNRLRGRIGQGDRGESLRRPSPSVFLRATAPPVQVLVVAGVVVWGFVNYARSLHGELQESQRALALAQQAAAAPNAANSAGRIPPPAYVPPRPERSVQATYYRGNDERNPQLFNGGFYRTATFHVSLRDADKKPLNVGDDVRGERLYVHVVIERAPNATASLFTQKIMGLVKLSPVTDNRKVPNLADEVVPFTLLREDEAWEAYYPVPLTNAVDTTLSGICFICKGDVTNDVLIGSLHYQIEYDLIIAGGKLAEGSNLSMGSLYRVGNLIVAQPNRIFHNEWFDSRPIPVITGDNSSDPKLLGVEEHLGKVEPSGQQPHATGSE